jgi:tetratricopeptide (TPR) repeat protein
MQEFKSAVNLAGDNHEMFYEVGKIFLSWWPLIAEEDKISTIHILKKSLQRNHRDKFLALLPIWEMNVHDYSVIREIIPKRRDFFHIYAQFLGEKSMSLKERKDVLVEAEFLDFEHARMRHQSGRAFLSAYQFEKAQGQFRICLNILRRIRFYQDLTGQNLIDVPQFENLQKLANLDMATSILGNRGEWSNAQKFLIPYLEREEKIEEVIRLEEYLYAKNLLPRKIEDSLRDMSELYLHLLILKKQKRYRDVTAIGQRLFEDVLFLMRGDKKGAILALLEVGGTFTMAGSTHVAMEYYWKALELNPASLEAMVRIRDVFSFTGEQTRLMEIQTRIDRLLSSSPLRFENLEIKRGEGVSRRLYMDGKQISLHLHFKKVGEGYPLVSIYFNGKVIWDGLLEDETLSFSLESKIGENLIHVQAVDSTFFWEGVDYQTGNE